MTTELYTYYRSSASYRVRIALNLKGIDYQAHYVHLLKDGGEQYQAEYQALNPQALVPTLKHDEGIFTQSLSIIEYLNECYPEPDFLPAGPSERAFVRAAAQHIVCEIHPVTNLRVLRYLEEQMKISPEDKIRWIHHWFILGLSALEKRLQHIASQGLYALGKQVTLIDICLVPCVYNALRFEVPLTDFKRIKSIYDHCMAQPAFVQAAPESQEDAYFN